MFTTVLITLCVSRTVRLPSITKFPARAKSALSETSPITSRVERKIVVSVTSNVELSVTSLSTCNVESTLRAPPIERAAFKDMSPNTSNEDSRIVAADTSNVELILTALSTCKVESILTAPPTDNSEFMEASPTTVIVELKVVASLTAKVDSMEVAPSTVKVFPKLTSLRMSALPDANNEPETSKFALVESLRLPIPVDAVTLWNVTTSNETSLVVMRIPLLSNDKEVLSSSAPPI